MTLQIETPKSSSTRRIYTHLCPSKQTFEVFLKRRTGRISYVSLPLSLSFRPTRHPNVRGEIRVLRVIPLTKYVFWLLIIFETRDYKGHDEKCPKQRLEGNDYIDVSRNRARIIQPIMYNFSGSHNYFPRQRFNKLLVRRNVIVILNDLFPEETSHKLVANTN